MSEHSLLPLVFKANIAKHGLKDFVLTEESIEQATSKVIKERQALDKKNAELRNDDGAIRKELNHLVNAHFDLKQWVKACENKINESSAQIRNLEQRLNNLIVQKQQMESPLGQRTLEHRITLLEGELAEEKKKFEKLRKENTTAIRQLKAFDVAKMEALKAELEPNIK